LEEAVKECCRLIRLARSRWNAHENKAARQERSRAMQLYSTLTSEQKDQIPQALRQWLRYRSEFYLGRPPKKRKKAPNPTPALKKKMPPPEKRSAAPGAKGNASESGDRPEGAD
jgi:hypothetical protein